MGSAPSQEDVRAKVEEAQEQQALRERLEAEMMTKGKDKQYWRGQSSILEKQLQDQSTATQKLYQERLNAENCKNEWQEKVWLLKNVRSKRLELIQGDIDKANKEYELNQSKVTEVINKTNVDKGSIPQFLNLINNGLLGGTLSNEVKTVELNAKLDAFSELIDRTTNTDISIKSKLSDRFQDYVPYLNKENYYNMNDMLCDDNAGFNYIIKIIKDGIDAENKGIKNENAKVKLLYPKRLDDIKKSKERREKIKKHPNIKALAKLCMRAQAEKGWKKQQKSKQRIVKKALCITSPALAEFFGTMNTVMTDARKYLEYNADYNSHQLKAIKIEKENENKLKEQKENEEKESDTNNIQENADNALSQISNKKHKVKLDRVQKENRAFLNASLVKLHVIDSMMDRFEGADFKETRKTGLILAKDVESCCLHIIRSQSTIRSSIIIARELIEFKPVKLSADAQSLWSVINGGIINIYNNYIEMAKVSVTYFGFFVKFQNGFEHYLSCHELLGDNVDLDVAMEYIKRDTREFKKFSAKMQKTVDELTNNAKTLIKDCIKESAGAYAFETAVKKRDEAQQKYMNKVHEMCKASCAVDPDLDEAIEKLGNAEKEYFIKDYEYTEATKHHEFLKEYLRKLKQMCY